MAKDNLPVKAEAEFETQVASARVGVGPPGAMEVATSKAAAEVQAAIVLAKRFPRDENVAFQRVMLACERTRLAEQALYAYPRGGITVTGPSIRLAETIARAWGNIDTGIIELEQRAGESIMMAYAWDLETNTRSTKVFTVPHIRHTREGDYALTDPRDVYEMTANQGTRRQRSCMLAVMPADLVEAAREKCEETLKAGSEVPKQDRIHRMIEAFAEQGVTLQMLEARLGHPLSPDATHETELVQLRAIYRSLRDNMAARDKFFKPPPDEGGKGTAGLRESLGVEEPAPPAEPPPAQEPFTAPAPSPHADRHAAAAKMFAAIPPGEHKIVVRSIPPKDDPELGWTYDGPTNKQGVALHDGPWNKLLEIELEGYDLPKGTRLRTASRPDDPAHSWGEGSACTVDLQAGKGGEGLGWSIVDGNYIIDGLHVRACVVAAPPPEVSDLPWFPDQPSRDDVGKYFIFGEVTEIPPKSDWVKEGRKRRKTFVAGEHEFDTLDTPNRLKDGLRWGVGTCVAGHLIDLLYTSADKPPLPLVDQLVPVTAPPRPNDSPRDGDTPQGGTDETAGKAAAPGGPSFTEMLPDAASETEKFEAAVRDLPDARIVELVEDGVLPKMYDAAPFGTRAVFTAVHALSHARIEAFGVDKYLPHAHADWRQKYVKLLKRILVTAPTDATPVYDPDDRKPDDTR